MLVYEGGRPPRHSTNDRDYEDNTKPQHRQHSSLTDFTAAKRPNKDRSRDQQQQQQQDGPFYVANIYYIRVGGKKITKRKSRVSLLVYTVLSIPSSPDRLLFSFYLFLLFSSSSSYSI